MKARFVLMALLLVFFGRTAIGQEETKVEVTADYSYYR